MSRALDDLDPRFKPKAMELLARCVEAGIMVMIIDTRRTEAEHQANLAKGVSWVKRSKHIDGLAIDICPFDYYDDNGPDKLNWDPSAPIWTRMGVIGESLGLIWGGRWKVRDLSHYELPTPKQSGTQAA